MSSKQQSRQNFDWQNFDWRKIDWNNARLLFVIPLVVLAFGVLNSVYTVQAESQGVVLRFGKYIKTVEPGLRFKMPFGIDHVQILPVKRQMVQDALKAFNQDLPCLGSVSFDTKGRIKNISFQILQITKTGPSVIKPDNFVSLLMQVYNRSPFD